MNNCECAICLQLVDSACVLECAKHGCSSVYHEECATRALDLITSCPVCRRNVAHEVIPLCLFLHQSVRTQRSSEEASGAQMNDIKTIVAALHADLAVLQQEHEEEKSSRQNLLSELRSIFIDIRKKYDGLSLQLEQLSLQLPATAPEPCSARCNIFLNAHVVTS